MNAHTALGIAQIIFYVPIVPVAIWLMTRNWSRRPRMAWYPFIPFSLMRLAGGLIVVLLNKDPTNIGLATATIVLLNVGAIPLIIAAAGFLRIVIMDNYKPTRNSKRFHGLLRVAIIFAIALLAAGGALGGQEDAGTRKIGHVLMLVGYGLFAALLVALTGAALWFWRKKAALIQSSPKFLLGILLSSPFMMARCVYGLLQVAFPLFSMWNPLYGSAVAFALMALLVEYIVVGIFFYIGFSTPPDRGVIGMDEEEDAGVKP